MVVVILLVTVCCLCERASICRHCERWQWLNATQITIKMGNLFPEVTERTTQPDNCNQCSVAESVLGSEETSSGENYVITIPWSTLCFLVDKKETQLTSPTALAQLQCDLSKKDMLFKKKDIKLGKVIGQGECSTVYLLLKSIVSYIGLIVSQEKQVWYTMDTLTKGVEEN